MLDNKLKICFFGEAKKEDIHTLKWAKFFADKGHNVHLISYSEPGDQKIDNITIHVLEKSFPIEIWPFNTLFNLPLTLLKVKKIIKKIKPDIVHAHCVTSYGTLASLIGFHPFVLTAWGSDILINPYNNKMTKWATKHALKKADLITCDANHMVEAIKKLSGDNSEIIYFGVDVEKFSPGQKDINLIKEWGFGENDKIVISLRGLEPIYNVETLIKAIPAVLKQSPETKFIIGGRGSEQEKLEQMARDLNAYDNIRFIGWADKEILEKYLRIADIYVSTSLSDAGLSSATAEAMSCGLPAIVTDSGENRVWVKDNKQGFVVPMKNPEMIAQKIIYLLNNEDQRSKMANGARQIIKNNNNYYFEMSKMENNYNKLKK